MADPQVLIVGAGPTGLVLALWLAKAGIPVRLVDKAPAPGATSRAVGVQARTLEFYRQLGIADAVVDAGVMVHAANLWSGGRKAGRLAFGDLGKGISPYPYMLIYPQDLHERLHLRELDKLGVIAERPVEFLGLEQNQDHVLGRLRHSDGSEEIVKTAYVAGCDGAHSQVRASLGIDFEGGTYEHIFYVADVEADGAAVNGEVHVAPGDDDFLAIFPMKGKGRARLIGSVRESALATDRPLTWDDANARTLDLVKLRVNKVNWFSTYRVHHRVASRFRDRRAFLLGDAAHVHSPVGGQGMNTGIGDAVNLAWKLADVLQGRGPATLLDSYEPERITFARKLVATTDRAFTFITSRGLLAKRIRRVAPMLLGALSRFRFLRRFLFLTISQIAINYRESSVSTGKAGKVRGGDRLPWVQTTVNQDNFASLSTLAWQVHVYGVPRPGVVDACAELRIPIHVFAWKSEMKRAGLMRGAIYLVRPDGHVALADPNGEANPLRHYLCRHWPPSP